MSSRINEKSIRESLKDDMIGDAAIIKDFATLLTFGVAIVSPQPMTLAAAGAMILTTAGSSLSAGLRIMTRLGASKRPSTTVVLDQIRRFELQYYCICYCSYVEAFKVNAKEIKELLKSGSKLDLSETRLASLQDSIRFMSDRLSDAEVAYTFCNVPSASRFPLFDALSEAMVQFFEAYGVARSTVASIANEILAQAVKRLHAKVASGDADVAHIRNFLALTYAHDTAMHSDMSAVVEVLRGWKESTGGENLRRTNRWIAYKDHLKSLPDAKETMYSEDFGVREVFIVPTATYHVAGTLERMKVAGTVPDLNVLLGALASTRTSGDDLIILCGGPGSGKSTLCRFLASELAADSDAHPVFLRLRRARDGGDIRSYIEEQLKSEGVIDHLQDLQDLPNVVIILDGFDELVAANRQLLRRFFNNLIDDVRTGPLRRAKVIVSGRDTLFPQGEGLPRGSHVINLKPFDASRVTLWGEKWRARHGSGPGRNFYPEKLLDSHTRVGKASPLHHLVSWPLTLHLVARVHTSGKLEIPTDGGASVPKAYLYRSIMEDTANRQTEQAHGQGRFQRKEMREFLRALAWEMYVRETDSMEPADVIPIINRFCGNGSESNLAELAETAVLNSPEIQKGEDTGFEFVHKSFAEFLQAERLARTLQEACQRVVDLDGQTTWRKLLSEAAVHVSDVFGVRLLPAEVQEMLEPMLGCVIEFGRGDRLGTINRSGEVQEQVEAILTRLEELYGEYIPGDQFDRITEPAKDRSSRANRLEAYANYGAGIVLVGGATARQLNLRKQESANAWFHAEPFEGAFWRYLSLLAAGNVRLDKDLCARLFDAISVVRSDSKSEVSDASAPIHIGRLLAVHGFRSYATQACDESIITSFVTFLVKSFQRGIARYGDALVSRDRVAMAQHEMNRILERSINRREGFNVFDSRSSSTRDSTLDVLSLMERLDQLEIIGITEELRDIYPAHDFIRRTLERSKDPYEHLEALNELRHRFRDPEIAHVIYQIRSLIEYLLLTPFDSTGEDRGMQVPA